MNVDIEKLKADIVSDLNIELGSQPTFNAELLEAKVNNVIKEVIALRGYEDSGYSDERATKDLARYYSVIRNVALYDYAQIGAPFELSHNENSVSRAWTNRNDLFVGVRKISNIF